MVWNSFENKEACTEMVDEKDYNVVMYDFLAYGGDKFEDLRFELLAGNGLLIGWDGSNRGTG